MTADNAAKEAVAWVGAAAGRWAASTDTQGDPIFGEPMPTLSVGGALFLLSFVKGAMHLPDAADPTMVAKQLRLAHACVVADA